ncbi:MAG: RluA family pseudouridine synthase [Alphaproteobacteria bacterium]|nr:RluA family pseudouridine synthase [Alphaproteobacteria bacterium]
MSKIQIITVSDDDDDIRLDRWFKRHYPEIKHVQLQKLLRTGQIKVDGKKAKSNSRVITGAEIRIPPVNVHVDDNYKNENPYKKERPMVSAHDAKDLQDSVIYMDDDIIVINKPAGLAVQGGSKTTKHLDGMLDALMFDKKERPKLVHRLDKDTSGALVLARSAKAAAKLTKAFLGHDVRKTYWALVVGKPELYEGVVNAPLMKMGNQFGEKVVVNEFEGKKAITEFRTIDRAMDQVTWLEMEPLTGRTHQLRVHSCYLGTPILGDGKYGRKEAFLSGTEIQSMKKLHLHARTITIQLPGKKLLEVSAPLSKHMAETFEFFGFDEKDGDANSCCRM